MGYVDSSGPEVAESDLAPHEGMSAKQYLATRFSTLRPPMLDVPNPIALLRMLNSQQWAFFFVAFAAWVSPPLMD